MALVAPVLPVAGPLAPEAWRTAGDVLRRRVPLVFPLIVYSALAGWTELLGLALRVRGRRIQEAATIVTLRASGLILAGAALWAGTGLRGLVWAMALSTLPPLALATAWPARTTAPASDALPAAGPDFRRDPQGRVPARGTGAWPC